MASIVEPENDSACWEWRRSPSLGNAYGKIDVYVPGLGRYKRLTAHIVTWIVYHQKPQSIDELYLWYVEFRCSGLELDHTCDNPVCVYVDHLEPKTHKQNMADGRARRAAELIRRMNQYDPHPVPALGPS